MNVLTIALVFLVLIPLYDYGRMVMTIFLKDRALGIALIAAVLLPILFPLFYYICYKNWDLVKAPFVRFHKVIIALFLIVFLAKGPSMFG